MSQETTKKYTFPHIELTDGDYTVSLLGYDVAYLFVRLMSKNMYTTQFATKVEMNSQINQTASEIDLSVNEKLTNYSTTTEMNSTINLKVDSIISSVNTKFENYDTSEEVSSKIEQKADSITTSVSKTYETKTNASNTYATKTQLTTAKSEIKQTTDSISSTVSKKVGNNEIISKINQSAETVTINAGKVNLSGYVTISNLQTAGKTTINGSNITTGTIDASKAKITNINADNIVSGTIKGRTITGGKIQGTTITGGSITIDAEAYNKLIQIRNIKNTSERVYLTPYGFVVDSKKGTGMATVGIDSDGNGIIDVSGGGYTSITGGGVRTPILTQTSLESIKKNIVKFDNALSIIENSEIYEYNLKEEKDTDKKHVGFIIGDKYKTPDEVKSNDGNAIESYSMDSINWRATQQILDILKDIKQRIDILEKK